MIDIFKAKLDLLEDLKSEIENIPGEDTFNLECCIDKIQIRIDKINIVLKELELNYNRYIELKMSIKQEIDFDRKEELASEFLRIGNKYNF